MPATRADVARAAGVSPAVVSYVLNGGPRPVSPANRARVLKAVQDLQYRPNRIARALRQRRTHSIALLMPDYLNPYFAEMAQAIEDEAFARDYILLIGTASNSPQHERAHLQAFVDRHVDGLLLISAVSDPDVSMITEAELPVVLLDRAAQGSPFSSVTVDNVAGARIGGEHLIAHRRDRLGCILGPPDIVAVTDRLKGWQQALGESGANALPPQYADFSRAGGYQAMQRLLDADLRPDGVFTSSDAQAIGAIRCCVDAGVVVGRDVSIVSFDGTEATSYSTPRLTTVDQDVGGIAREAVSVLLEQVADRQSIEHRVLTPVVRIGESCGCRAGDGPDSRV